MGIEWTFVCRSRQQHAWLGSMKPAKWGGFRAGNRQVIELMRIHAGCEWALIRDDTSTDTPWLDTIQNSPSQVNLWREDLRSRSLWQPHTYRSRVACAWCATGDSRTSQGVPISTGLWFCSSACRDD
jgi:hypothetical protein